jgi:L-lactate dehydrogenase complex protein LldG
MTREQILARIRRANATAASQPPPIPRDYRTEGAYPPGDPHLVELFTDRLVDYKATVHTTTPDALASLVDSIAGGWTLVTPGLAPPVPAVPVNGETDKPHTHAELDRVDAVVTQCAAACAETGTIVLDGGDGQGRRALSLIPDRHICIVAADQIVHTVPELLRRLDPTRPLTFISGPSATSDIELNRVEGVHGPRTLIVIIVSTA